MSDETKSNWNYFGFPALTYIAVGTKTGWEYKTRKDELEKKADSLNDIDYGQLEIQTNQETDAFNNQVIEIAPPNTMQTPYSPKPILNESSLALLAVGTVALGIGIYNK